MSIESSKPFLKWAGGKTQLLKDIELALPKELFTGKPFTYIEPFIGSGAVLFWMLKQFPNLKQAVINDINPDLAGAYKVIKTKPRKLISVLSDLQARYAALKNEEARKDFYLKQRELYNAKNVDDIENSALLIFLNRTCFNGLYRVNSKGSFNVPFGRYTNPTICDENTILADSHALRNVVILQGDFEQTLEYANESAFYYLDPPYKPLNTTSHFTSYAAGAFTDSDQIRLKSYCNRIADLGGRFMLSNSDVALYNNEYFDKLYSEFNVNRVLAKRSINANAAKRGTLTELIVTNYAPPQTAKSIRA